MASVDLRRAFCRAQPFGHAVQDGFLEPRLFAAVLAELRGLRPAPRADGYEGRLLTRDLRPLGNACAELEERLRSSEFLAWVEETTGESGLIRNPDGGCGGVFRDGHGAELEPHVDVNCTVAGRRRLATLILYLHPQWRPQWGGALELFAGPDERAAKTVAPEPNRAVLMASNESAWHGFAPVDLPPTSRAVGRRALIVNFYGRGAAPKHFNTWMPRPAPASLREGRPLTPEDARDVRRLHARRLELLRELQTLELAVEPRARKTEAPALPQTLRSGRALSGADALAIAATFAALDAELRRLYRVEHAYRRRLERRGGSR